MKVFAWEGFRDEAQPRPNGSRQTREVLAARSAAEAMRISGQSRHFFKEYVCETGNDEEVRVAMSKPGTVFWTELNHSLRAGDWLEAK